MDWWKVTFKSSGSANFWLGNIPSGCNYDLYLYSTNGAKQLGRSTNSGTANELITYAVSVNTFYYIKIIPRSGYSTTSSYLLRAKLYPTQSQTTVNVESKNNTAAMAKNIVEDTDNYGYISSARDVNWWKITFTSSGTANFYLGNIPARCNYNLFVYSSDNLKTPFQQSINSGTANELITCYVSAGTYYIKITSAYGSSSSSRYLLRTKLYPTKTITSVPLYEQQENDTCGSACAIMILKSYGITVSERIFKQIAWDKTGGIPDGYCDHDAITETINDFLQDNEYDRMYKCKQIGGNNCNNTRFMDMMWRNIANDHPVEILIRNKVYIRETDYFPYTTDGHYLVLKGIGYNRSGGYTAILNDPHNVVGKATRIVPVDFTWARIKEYRDDLGYGSYIIYVDD